MDAKQYFNAEIVASNGGTLYLGFSSKRLPGETGAFFAPHEIDAIIRLLTEKKAELVEARKTKPKYVSFENSFITDDGKLPYGYDTVVGYLAKHDPDQLRALRDPVNDTSRAGFWCKARTEREGYCVVKVPAPPAIVARGITELNAYPTSVLAERLVA